jgi:hypothetical protein
MARIRPRLRPSLLAAALTLVALLIAPATGQAAVTMLGSDLKAPANVIEHHGADSAFWNISLQGGYGTVAPTGGQVTEVKVKGTVIPDPSGRMQPNGMFHFQSIHPMGDGTTLVELSSRAFYAPIGGDPNTISTYYPLNMCLHKGDYLDFNDIGGNQWHWGSYDGMPFQVFSRVEGSTTNFYTKDNGTNIGTRWAPMATKQGEELLMQMKFASGPDATDICPGGYQQHVFPGLKVKTSQPSTLVTRARTMNIRTLCPGPSYGSCKGTLHVDATIGGRRVVIATGGFDVQPAYTKTITVALSGANTTAIQKAGGVTATVVADAHDNPTGDTRANPGVPVQQKTTRATIQIVPDQPYRKR